MLHLQVQGNDHPVLVLAKAQDLGLLALVRVYHISQKYPIYVCILLATCAAKHFTTNKIFNHFNYSCTQQQSHLYTKNSQYGVIT